jgi:hypothetical protein
VPLNPCPGFSDVEHKAELDAAQTELSVAVAESDLPLAQRLTPFREKGAERLAFGGHGLRDPGAGERALLGQSQVDPHGR